LNVENLIQEHQNAVYRQMIRVCHGNKDDADDALAEAILSALRAADSLRDENAFRPWLARIATRICLRIRSRHDVSCAFQLSNIDEALLPSDSSYSPQVEVEHAEFRSKVRTVINDLPEIYRGVYINSDIEGYSLAELTESMQITQAAAKSRLRRARHMVRNMLNDALDDKFVEEDRELVAS
jgi:RNA polymerase sigma-70 factor (ECF subfamily)